MAQLSLGWNLLVWSTSAVASYWSSPPPTGRTFSGTSSGSPPAAGGPSWTAFRRWGRSPYHQPANGTAVKADLRTGFIGSRLRSPSGKVRWMRLPLSEPWNRLHCYLIFLSAAPPIYFLFSQFPIRNPGEKDTFIFKNQNIIFLRFSLLLLKNSSRN